MMKTPILTIGIAAAVLVGCKSSHPHPQMGAFEYMEFQTEVVDALEKKIAQKSNDDEEFRMFRFGNPDKLANERWKFHEVITGADGNKYPVYRRKRNF